MLVDTQSIIMSQQSAYEYTQMILNVPLLLTLAREILSQDIVIVTYMVIR